MKCDSKQWDNCEIEKRGCKGCYYDERLRLDFSKNGEGSVLITSFDNTLYLDKIKQKMKLGEEIKLEDCNIEKAIELNFYKVESIDYLIKHLEKIKDFLLEISAS